MPVDFAMVEPTNRDGELIAHLSAQRTRLGETEVMRVRRRAATNNARMGRHEPAVLLVTQADGLWGNASTVRTQVIRGIRGLRVGLRLALFLSILVELDRLRPI